MRYTALFVIIILFVNFAIAQQKPYYPLRIKNNIILDGKLAEAEWQQAEQKLILCSTIPPPALNQRRKQKYGYYITTHIYLLASGLTTIILKN